MEYPPDLAEDDLDLSIFHPLGHRPFSRRCSQFHPGGRWRSGRHHVVLVWRYRFRDALWAATLCKIGWHDPVTSFYRSTQTMQQICGSCFSDLGPEQPMDRISH